jgi:hypothetical protein
MRDGRSFAFRSARPSRGLLDGGALMLSMMVATCTLLSAAFVSYWDQRKHR